MTQIEYEYDGIDEALSGLQEIRKMIEGTPHSDVLAQIFTNNCARDEVGRLVSEMDRVLPGVKRVGITEHTFTDRSNIKLIKINLILGSSSQFFVFQLPCEDGGEAAVAETLREKLSEIPFVRGIEIFPAGTELNVTEFLERAGRDLPDIPFFGAMASSFNDITSLTAYDDNVFGIGEVFLAHGFTIAVFAGERLQLHMDYVLGWHPIGKELEVTLGPKGDKGESYVTLIDGAPAVEVYRKYLGVTWNKDFIWNVCEFPLMVERNGVDICLIPMSKCDRGGLFFSGTIKEDDRLRFSYATREDVLGASMDGTRQLVDFSADAVFLSLCGNRINFLQDEAHLEWDRYRKYFPNLVFCHGHFEVAYMNGRGGVLNSSIVSVGIREGEGSSNVTPSFGQSQESAAGDGPIPLSYRMSNFLHAITDELLHLQHNLEDEVARKTRENEGLAFHVVQTLAAAIDAKDKYTNGHSSRVAKYSREIARRAGFSWDDQNHIFMMGLLHDVGKIGIPNAIINKPGRLTDDEFEIIKTHPGKGAGILKSITEMPGLATGAHWHHERYDGRGYPDGLHGDEIPEPARIIAVADAYDAMTSNRSYRDVMPQEKVREQIEKGIGTQFDPRFAKIMLEMIDEDADYTMREL